jgi:Gpi18-like mannosyltransferase
MVVNFLKKYRLDFLIFFSSFILNGAVFLFSTLRFSNDDQFILYRYIRNLAFGNGFVYNQGEHILGATTATFTLLASFWQWVFKSVSTPDVVAVLNLFLISLAAVFFYKVLRKLVENQIALLGSAIFILNLSKVIPEGMETSLFILLSFSLIYFVLEQKNYLASVVLGLLVLTRPDALLIALLIFIFSFTKIGWEKTLKLALISAVIVLPWLLFATFYFGSFIPQSLLAKLHTKDIVIQSNLQAFKVQLASLSRIYWGKIFDPNNIYWQVLFNLLP